jgi:hypothetical protein
MQSSTCQSFPHWARDLLSGDVVLTLRANIRGMLTGTPRYQNVCKVHLERSTNKFVLNKAGAIMSQMIQINVCSILRYPICGLAYFRFEVLLGSLVLGNLHLHMRHNQSSTHCIQSPPPQIYLSTLSYKLFPPVNQSLSSDKYPITTT